MTGKNWYNLPAPKKRYFMNGIAVDFVATADVIKIIFRIENLHLDAI